MLICNVCHDIPTNSPVHAPHKSFKLCMKAKAAETDTFKTTTPTEAKTMLDSIPSSQICPSGASGASAVAPSMAAAVLLGVAVSALSRSY